MPSLKGYDYRESQAVIKETLLVLWLTVDYRKHCHVLCEFFSPHSGGSAYSWVFNPLRTACLKASCSFVVMMHQRSTDE